MPTNQLKMFEIEHIETDVLVLGGGIAGYRAAIAARKSGINVAITFRSHGASPYIIGFNTPIGHEDQMDSIENYYNDMVKGGYHLNDRRLVQVMAEESPQAFWDLIKLNVPFSGNIDPLTHLFKASQRHLSGNSYARSVYVPNGTGISILKALQAESDARGITSIPSMKVVDILTDDNGAVTGAVLWRQNSKNIKIVHSQSVVMAMGGIGQLYSDSTYPVDVTSDSIGFGIDAGAIIVDMEFVQFEPVVTIWPEKCRGMEMPTAMLGDGAQLKNNINDRFMFKHNPEHGERQIEKAKMAIFIQQEINEGRGLSPGGVLFDTTTVEKSKLESYISHCKRLRSAGLEPTIESPIVAPAAHSIMGGIHIDQNGWTGVPGLFAGGESTGGVHGASRIAGNGCTDTLVFGAVAGRNAAKNINPLFNRNKAAIEKKVTTKITNRIGNGTANPSAFKLRIQTLVNNSAGIFRKEKSLADGLSEIKLLKNEIDSALASNFNDYIGLMEARRMIISAEMIIKASMLRQESRGSHLRTDYPNQDDANWLKHIGFTQKANGELTNLFIQIY